LDGELSIQEIQKYNETTRVPLATSKDGCFLYADIHVMGKIFLHFGFNEGFKFTPSTYKRMIRDFDEVCAWFKSKGVRYLFAVVPDEERILKWEGMFGLVPTQAIHDNKGNIKFAIVRKEL